MMVDLTVECIICNAPKEFNKFVRSSESKSSKVINYVSIRNKLSKSDPYGKDPNDSIVGLTITNELSRSLRSSSKRVDNVFYLIRNLDYNTISNFKSMISEITDREFLLNLNILNVKLELDEDTKSLFDTIRSISND
jgi:hypothetical protein